jgi:predicted alpha/beta hydrolase family esterase
LNQTVADLKYLYRFNENTECPYKFNENTEYRYKFKAMAKLFVFTHGVAGSPDSCFFPVLRSVVVQRGHHVHSPIYPDTADPDFPAWKATFDRDIASVWDTHSDIILVSHSLGGYFTLRLLGESAGSDWVGHVTGVVLVAPTSLKRPERRRFYAEEVRWAAIAPLQFKLVLLYSDDDDKVTRAHQDLIVEKLGAMDGFEFRQLSGWKHFIALDAPPVTEAVLLFA